MASENGTAAGKDKPAAEAQRDGSGGSYTDWAAAMQAYYKVPPGHAHVGAYYAAPMTAAHHPYMWAAQPMMSPYGGPPSPYYGAMYPQQPQMPPPSTAAAYGYAPPQGQPKEGAEMAAPAHGGTPPGRMDLSGPGSGRDGSGTEGHSSGGSDEPMATPPGGVASGGMPASGYPYAAGGQEMWGLGGGMAANRASGPVAEGSTPQFQDEREVKRQRRKQSNRESARRSRLRKQAECEGLGSKVQGLVSQNENLKKEVIKLQERCVALTTNNASLLEQLTQAKTSGTISVGPTSDAAPSSRDSNKASAPPGQARTSRNVVKGDALPAKAAAADNLSKKEPDANPPVSTWQQPAEIAPVMASA